MYWDGVRTDIKDGLKIKSSKYEYIIEKNLNQGAMAYAYKANRSDGKEIFLKQYITPNIHQSDWADFIKFQHSIVKTLMQIPSSISEVNYEYFEFEGNHFHAKAFERGKDLNTMIFDDRPDIETRFHIVKTSLGILKAIHKKGIVHSDLKPQQFFIVNDNGATIGFRIKLIDYDHCLIPALNLSRPAGTAGWMSPEHVNEKNIGFHSDVFTMGQIIYTLITGGRQPYAHSLKNGTYEEDILNKNGYISLTTLFKGEIPEISEIVDNMLDPNYNNRPTIEEVHKGIMEALNKSDKPKHIQLESNGKSRLIVQTQIITREIVKSSFGNHSEIYNKQFEIMKDNSGAWFVKGYDVPPTAKDSKGNVYHFHKTFYNGNNTTGKYLEIEDGGVITVGNVEFKIKAT